MSSRKRSAPSYLDAYAGSSGSDGDDRSSDEDVDPQALRRRTQQQQRSGGGAGGGGGGGARVKKARPSAGSRPAREEDAYRGHSSAAVAPSAASSRPRRQTVMTTAAAVALADEADEAAAREGRSARQQGAKRKSYREVEEHEIDYFDQTGADSETTAAAARRSPAAAAGGATAGSAKKQKKSVTSSQYLNLNACLGRSQIERILARRRMASPETAFLSTLIAQMAPHRQRLVHPDDLQRFAPDLFREHQAQWKAEEARTIAEQQQQHAGDSFSLMPETPSASPDLSSSHGSFRGRPPVGEGEGDEWWYLVKWKGRSYAPLALRWIPHSLLLLFEDGATRLRRYERTRELGEARATTRISKSDEELEQDEQSSIDLARALRMRTLDEEQLRKQVASKEERIRAQQDALTPAHSASLAALVAAATAASQSPADTSSSSTAPSVDAPASGTADATLSSTSAESTAVAAPAASTPRLSGAQLEELEHSLEAGRIARRLADIENDHKLARFKKIRNGYFDVDYASVERIVGHRRRAQGQRRESGLYLNGATTMDHWNYFGWGRSVRLIEQLLEAYVTDVDAHMKRGMLDLAEAIDPRIGEQRPEWERSIALHNTHSGMATGTAKSERRPSGALKREATDDAKGGEEDEKKHVPAEAKSLPPPVMAAWMHDLADGDDEKDESVSAAAAAAASGGSAKPAKESAAASRSSRPSVSPPAPISSRPRRAAALKARLLDSSPHDDDAFVASDDDSDLKRALRASANEAAKPPAARNAGPSPDADGADSDGEQFEFLVKWAKLSYDQCTWETRADLKRMDRMRQQATTTTTTQPESVSLASDLNPSVPIPSLSFLPFQPLSSLLVANNLLLKYIDLPIVVSDETHSAAIQSEMRRRNKEEKEREEGTIGDAAHAQLVAPHRAAIHPTVSLSAVQGHSAAVSAAPSPNRVQPPPPVQMLGMEALRRYLLTHSSRTRHASIVYPNNSKNSAGAADALASNDNLNGPALFRMNGPAVTGEMRFGRDHNMQLRPYQVDGINWLAINWATGRNSILADEMGLGKTVQSTLLLDYMVTRQHLVHPILVVAPLSTISFWLREVERFSQLYGIIYRGSPEARKIIREWDWKWPSSAAQLDELDQMRKEEGVDVSALPPWQQLAAPSSRGGVQRRAFKFNVLITTYETILQDFAILSRIPFSALVIDEAQRLKSSSSKLFERLQQLQIPRKLLLTGTPIQNDLTELFSLLHFISPAHFSSCASFLAECGSMSTLAQVTRLYTQLRPYVLRRLKSDVEKALPSKEEILIEIELTRLQKKWYKAVYERNYALLTGKRSDGSKQVNSLVNVSMQLRKVSQHPYLMDGCEAEELETLARSLPPGASLSIDAVMERLVNSSAKFNLLDKLLPKLKAEGHRVLIFSQMTRVLDILQDYLLYRRYKHERLDGNVGTAERQLSIDKFSEPNSDIFAFLLSTRAGGLGITLTAADTVIIFDSDWNLLNDMQAIDRSHRIGQQKDVTCYRLITKGTYEHEMFARSCRKLTLDRVIMASLSQEVSSNGGGGGGGGGGGANNANDDALSTPFDKREVEDLLKRGAYNIFSSPESEESAELQSMQFAEENIDRILQRSQVVKYEAENANGAIKVEIQPEGSAAGAGSAGGSSASASPSPAAAPRSGVSTFSKASFVPRDGGDELSMSDPLFWVKLGMEDKSQQQDGAVAGMAVGAPPEVLEGKRARKKATVFNAGDNDVDDGAHVETEGAAAPTDAASSRLGPSRCQVCFLVTRADETTPILICDLCDEEAHLTCLGLAAVPNEEHWHCPTCVETQAKKKNAHKGRDADEDKEYRPDPSVRRQAAAAGLVGTGVHSHQAVAAMGLRKPAVTPVVKAPAAPLQKPAAKPLAPTPAPAPAPSKAPLPSVAPPAADATKSALLPAADLRAQYARLLGTYRVTHPTRSDKQHREMADSMWRSVFHTEPPDTRAVAATAAVTPVHTPSANSGAPSPLVQQQPQAPFALPLSTPSSFGSACSSSPSSVSAFRMTPSATSSQLASLAPSVAAPNSRISSIHSAPPPPSGASTSASSSLGAAAAPPRAKCSAPLCVRLDGDAGAPFNLCGKCRQTRYCSRECQAADWKAGHKQRCKAIAAQ